MGGQRFDLKDYIPVQERINFFWRDYPDGHITTQLMSDPEDFTLCRYRAEVYRSLEDKRPAATGHAFERAGQGMANQTSHEENCETSAIGRALANLGYATSHSQRPSREEMGKVQRAEAEHKPKATPAQAPQQPPQQPAPVEAQQPVADKDDAAAPINQKGMGALHAAAGKRNLSHDDVKAMAVARYGVTSTKELTVGQGRELYVWLSQTPDEQLVDLVVAAREQLRRSGVNPMFA
jgi:hypothetical protein